MANSNKSFRHILIKWVITPVFVVILGFHLMVVALLFHWKTNPVNNSMFMIAHRLGGGSVTQTWVDYNQIAKSAKQAAIASEDANFVNHHGFDVEGIKLAMELNKKTGEISAGGSTISQQLAKNLFLTSHRSYVRKAEEAVITTMIEKFWDKERILTVYLNVVEFGNGIYGIEAAAQHYFNKSADKLNKDQSALLLSLLPNPKYYEKNLQNKRLQNKKRIIARRLSSANIP